jgi:multisubunit Na+/H+ antiporter MnhF subunit
VAILNDWAVAFLALLPPLAAALWRCSRGPIAARLVAVQFTTTLAAIAVAVASFAADQPSYVDLALALGLLSLPGSLLMAAFVEQWL